MSLQRHVAKKPRRPRASNSGEETPLPVQFVRKLPVGAEIVPSGGVHFRVWAPKSNEVGVELFDSGAERPGDYRLIRSAQGYHEGFVPEARPGMRYKYRLAHGSFPDPVSRFQPEGPHGPSEIIDPLHFEWTDHAWTGVTRHKQVIYELHIGTFTPEGTFAAAQRELEELARLGVTLIEVMPVADFPGNFGWGYDGVCLYAPTRLYGRPEDMKRFVDRAHQLGLGVILDVVYNHLGPDGNFLKEFSEDYFTDRYKNEWGQALNFDGEHAGPSREFFYSNAAYWIDEFHLDGLRLDATQQMFDASPNHILGVISRKAREAAGDRRIFLVAEHESQNSDLARPFEDGGFGLEAVWNDDFHHVARVALTGHNEAYYGDFKGRPQEFISAVKWGYLYQGQYYGWQAKARGTPAFGLEPEQFVAYIENHDQVANSLRGARLRQVASAGRLRALTALLLLGPNTPMLFQGQEFGATAPFLFFADHNPELSKLVAKGRGEFLRQFKSIAAAECDAYLLDPCSAETFQRCKLDLTERERHVSWYRLHKDLLRLRREDPVFSSPRAGGVDGAVLGSDAFALRFFSEHGQDRLLLINLGVDRALTSMPEPLLAPPPQHRWTLLWSSENPAYGGYGTAPLELDKLWRLPGQAGLVLASEPLPE